MKRFKKRTIALVLASVVTVVGAFGAENYKNSLMSISFEQASGGAYNVVFETKTQYEGSLTPMRRDANTYVVTLPECNSLAATPDIQKTGGNITSVNIRTMPYSSTSKGYTRITIKTINPSLVLNAENRVFIPSESYQALEDYSYNTPNKVQQKQEEYKYQEESYEEPVSVKTENTTTTEQATDEPTQSYSGLTIVEDTAEDAQKGSYSDTVYDNIKPDSTETLLLILGVLLVGTIIIFTLIKTREKLNEIAGEPVDIDTRDETKPQKKTKSKKQKLKKIKNTIKTLDSTYPKTAVMPNVNDYVAPSAPVNTVTASDNVVDLDELFQEQQAKGASEDDENSALEDFLSGFSFDEEFGFFETEEIDTVGYDEEFYEEVLNNLSMKFSDDDITCINKLLNAEINDDTVRNINEYAVSNPIKKIPSKQEILENLVTTYSISQDIRFTQDDIGILNKLLDFELDKDFVTDLRTNPELTKRMEETDSDKANKPKKISEILTLNVKDMLPDLSEALKQQGSRKIESEAKPMVADYHNNCEIGKLAINDILPDLSIEINKKDAFVTKPQNIEIQYAETGYEVEKFKAVADLPNLADALNNPEKYIEKEPEHVVVDEEALLNNILNVQFKPFDDGTREFETLNQPTDFENIQDEFKDFENFEFTRNDDEPINESPKDEYDDFAALFSDDFVDLDKQLSSEKEIVEPIAEEVEPLKIEDLAQDEEKTEFATDVEEEKPENTEKNQEKTTALKIEDDTKNNLNNLMPIKTKKEEIKEVQEAKAITTVAPSNVPVRKSSSEDLMKRIENSKLERENRIRQLSANQNTRTQNKTQNSVSNTNSTKESTSLLKCIIDGETFNVISSVEFNDTAGCYLAKNENGYTVLGHTGKKLFKLRHYETLKSEKIQARLSEKLNDGSTRYIVRIGLTKLIICVSQNNINFVMDL